MVPTSYILGSVCALIFTYWILISVFLNILYAISGEWNIPGAFVTPIGVGILIVSCAVSLKVYCNCRNESESISHNVSHDTEIIAVERYVHELETFKICQDIEGQKNEIPAQFSTTSTQLNRSCCICLNDFQKVEELARLRLCKHYFHLSCITEWIKNKPSCPLCNNQLKASEDGHTPPGENVDITEEENKQQTISENNI
mmetsp:Transcript_25097/g.31301  ORF Transcript_25097/g.31301 Transcript_25097/m.31301 type:complete len:200 (+) Transcript_25097:71-670(+)